MDAIPGLRDGFIFLFYEKKEPVIRPALKTLPSGQDPTPRSYYSQALLITPSISEIRASTIKM
jgi:hypothetical protein